jgi:hypothetical protein
VLNYDIYDVRTKVLLFYLVTRHGCRGKATFMARPSKLEKMAKARQISLEKLISEALAAANGNEFKAAMALGVYPNALRYHRAKQAVKPVSN